jgi:hypothetical protein
MSGERIAEAGRFVIEILLAESELATSDARRTLRDSP